MNYLFLPISLFVFFIIHYVSYDFLVRIFQIKKKRLKYILRGLFFFAFVSFILSAILVRLDLNIFTRVYYLLAGFSLGLILNVLWAILLYWLCYPFLNFFININNLRRLGKILLLLVFLFSLFSVYTAYNPVVNTVSIPLADLSSDWQGKKIVQLSDVHLGAFFGRRKLDQIVKQVNNLDPDLIVITGDLFDGMNGEAMNYAEGLKNFKAKSGVFFVRGNHEIYAGPESSEKALKYAEIKVLNDEVVDLGSLQLLGVAYPGFGEKRSLEKILSDNPIYDPNKSNILLFHAPINVASLDNDGHSGIYFRHNTDFSQVAALGIDLQLSGHTHRGQFFPFNLITKSIFSGFDYGLRQVGDFYIYTSSGTGVWGPSMRNISRSEIVEIILE